MPPFVKPGHNSSFLYLAIAVEVAIFALIAPNFFTLANFFEIARLNAELNAVLNDPAVRERLAVLGIEPTPGTPEQFRQQMQRDLAAYGPIVKAAGIKLE